MSIRMPIRPTPVIPLDPRERKLRAARELVRDAMARSGRYGVWLDPEGKATLAEVTRLLTEVIGDD